MSAVLSENLSTGQLEHVATVAKRRTGRKPSPATIWRWCRKGLRGGNIKLDAAYSGYWMTTDAAFDAFLAAQTEAAFAAESSVKDGQLEAAGLL